MFLRLLFVLLVALNIAIAAWLLLGQDGGYARGASDPGVPVLHLLSEQEPPRAVATSVPTPAVASSTAQGRASTSPTNPSPVPMPPVVTTAASPATSVSPPVSSSSALPPSASPTPNPGPLRTLRYACIAIGPFATPQDLRAARIALAPHTARLRSRQEQTTQSRGWWVFLPASTNRAQALALATRLDAAHVGEYFVVSAGDQSNTISLGLFKDPANARNRRDEVRAAGFPAQMSERIETAPEYWLDAALNDPAFDWRRHLRTADVGSHGTACF